MAKNKRRSRYTERQLNEEFYNGFYLSDTRYYGLFITKKHVNIDPKRLIKMMPNKITNEEFDVMSRRNTRYFVPLKRKQTDYNIFLFLRELEIIKKQWLEEYKPLIDETIKNIVARQYEVGNDANLHAGIDSVHAAEMRTIVKNMQAEQEAKVKKEIVISSMYAQFFHQAAAQLEAITVKVLFLRNVKPKLSLRDAMAGALQTSKTDFEKILNYKYHNALYRIWNFIKHNNEDTYDKLKTDYPSALRKGKYTQGNLAIYYVDFSDELFETLFKGLKNFYIDYCEKAFEETLFDSKWNFDKHFLDLVNNYIEDIDNPLGLDEFSDL